MSKNSLVPKISDFLCNYQSSNRFGTCKRCSKNVYWSTVKVASHIRSGHCKGASEAEISRFKHIFSLQQKLVYETPNHLSKKSFEKSLRSANDSNNSTENGETSEQVSVDNIFIKQEPKDNRRSSVKRRKQDSDDEDSDDLSEDETDDPSYEFASSNVKIKIEEVTFDSNDPIQVTQPKRSALAGSDKEDKFIATIYPQFKGKTKMDLIDEILNLKRQIELLEIKVDKYEDTISKLL